MVQGPFPIQDEEGKELTSRGAPERAHGRTAWLLVIAVALLLTLIAVVAGTRGLPSGDDVDAEASMSRGLALAP